MFSSDILFTAQILGERADYAHKRMKSVIDEISAQVSTTDPKSDVYKLNAAGVGERVKVGEHTYKLFELSREYYALTYGAFNCASAPLGELWHVDASSLAEYAPQTGLPHKSVPVPEKAQAEAVAAYCDPSLVTAEERDGGYWLVKSDERVKLDFGGIAKGYAADECVKILNEYNISSALIDISGNAYFYGDYAGGDGAWNVGITSPRPRGGETLSSRGYVCAVSVGGNTSAVTSGDYMRYAIHDGADGKPVYIPHIITPSGVPVGVEYRDGEWVNSDEYVISATVIGQSSALCDALSTAVCALGFEDGARLLQKSGCKGLIFTEKRYTIIGDVQLYRPDVYNGYSEYAFSEP